MQKFTAVNLKSIFDEEDQQNFWLVSSNVTTQGAGWEKKFKEMVTDGNIKNRMGTTVAIITGSHGSKSGDTAFDSPKFHDKKMAERDIKRCENLKRDDAYSFINFMPVDLGKFNQDEEKVFKHLEEIRADFIFVAFCYGLNSNFLARLKDRFVLFREFYGTIIYRPKIGSNWRICVINQTPIANHIPYKSTQIVFEKSPGKFIESSLNTTYSMASD